MGHFISIACCCRWPALVDTNCVVVSGRIYLVPLASSFFGRQPLLLWLWSNHVLNFPKGSRHLCIPHGQPSEPTEALLCMVPCAVITTKVALLCGSLILEEALWGMSRKAGRHSQTGSNRSILDITFYTSSASSI